MNKGTTENNYVKNIPTRKIQKDYSMTFFPYEARSIQKEMFQDIEMALNCGRHIVMESGTGTGKTIVSLAAALEYAKNTEKKIIFLTRTVSQTDQVMNEIRSINKINQIPQILGVVFSGREKSCPFLKTIKNHDEISSNVLARICENNKKRRTHRENGCKFFLEMKRHFSEIRSYCFKNIPTSDAFDNYCVIMGACPYEAKKLIMRDAKIIAAPYVNVLSADIRGSFFKYAKNNYSDTIFIIDEAHNIIDTARKQGSFAIHMTLIKQTIEEVVRYRSPIYSNIMILDFLNEIRILLKSFSNERLSFKTREHLIGEELESNLCNKFSVTKAELLTILERMTVIGQEEVDNSIKIGENKVSKLLILSKYLMAWVMLDTDKFIKIVKVDSDEAFYAACIDPYDITSFFCSLKRVVHMSGTLKPISQYVEMMNLPEDTITKIYPTPFPPENKAIIYSGEVTTRYQDLDSFMVCKITKYITELCNGINKNTLVLFPSYNIMSKMKPLLEGSIKKRLFWEEHGKRIKTITALNKFKREKSGVFFAVIGGSIAEGIDFPGEELCFVIIVGIPFEPPSLELKAIINKINLQHGNNGFKYASLVPAIRKIQQAIGRLIRSETDRGAAVILDNRVSMYSDDLNAILSCNLLTDVTSFFRIRG